MLKVWEEQSRKLPTSILTVFACPQEGQYIYVRRRSILDVLVLETLLVAVCCSANECKGTILGLSTNPLCICRNCGADKRKMV